MQETTNSVRPIRISPAVFLAALSLAFVTGWLVGLAPDFLGWFGKFILYWVSIPICLVLLVVGLIKMLSASDITGVSSSKNAVSYVLSPEDLARWRSIKRGMDRHEVTAILGQPDGPPVVVNTSYYVKMFNHLESSFDGKIFYQWGGGSVFFEPNGGPVFHVSIPEYI
jgi:hypothetical protein